MLSPNLNFGFREISSSERERSFRYDALPPATILDIFDPHCIDMCIRIMRRGFGAMGKTGEQEGRGRILFRGVQHDVVEAIRRS